ncbi:hypothetical protein CGJ28_26675, partial [Vibrio parahaemolyticus]
TEMHDREELKKLASLSEIQNSYFNFFEQNFGGFYKLMLKRKLTPHDAGRAAMQSEGSIREARIQVRSATLPHLSSHA